MLTLTLVLYTQGNRIDWEINRLARWLLLYNLSYIINWDTRLFSMIAHIVT